MPESKVTLVRPDGSLLKATPEQADKLRLLGYREEKPFEQIDRAAEAGREDYYSTGGQKVKAVLEGVGRGATLGGTDYLFGDEDTKARAQYNPGTAMASEALGALLPLAMTLGGSAEAQGASLVGRIAASTPAGAATEIGQLAARGLGIESAAGRAVAAGTIEGGIFGGAQAADQAYLADDPITAETVLHGVGFGALFGAGTMAAGEGLIAGGKYFGRLAKQAEEKAAVASGVVREGLESPYLADLGSTIPRSESFVKDVTDSAGWKGMQREAFVEGPLGGSSEKVAIAEARAAEANAAAKSAQDAADDAARRVESGILDEGQAQQIAAVQAKVNAAAETVRQAEERVAATEAAAQAAAKKLEQHSDVSLVDMHANDYAPLYTEIKRLNDKLAGASAAADAVMASTTRKLANLGASEVKEAGVTHASLALLKNRVTKAYGEVMEAVKVGDAGMKKAALEDYKEVIESVTSKLKLTGKLGNPGAALDELAQVAALQTELKNFPRSVSSFAKMPQERAERLFAALEGATKLSAFPELGRAATFAMDQFGTALGIEAAGVPGLRSAHDALVASLKAQPKVRAAVTKEAQASAREARAAAAKEVAARREAAKAAKEAHQTALKAHEAAKKEVEGLAGVAAAAKKEAVRKAEAALEQARKATEKAAKKVAKAAEKAQKANTKAAKDEAKKYARAVERENEAHEAAKRAQADAAEKLKKAQEAEEADDLGATILGLGVAAVVGDLGGALLAGTALGGGRKGMRGAWKMLAGLRAAGLARVRNAAANYLPKAGPALSAVGPKVEPLARKLDGSLDNSTKDKRALAAARIKEMWAAYPTINDTLYRGVEGLGVSQPKLGAAVHKSAAEAFRTVLRDVPRDPGVVSGLKSIWAPSDLQAETLSRRLAVFHDPIGEAEQMVATGNFDPIKVQTLKGVAPNVYQELRLGMLDRLAEPDVASKMTYRDQIGLSTLLDLPIHSSMRPEHIAASLQLFQERNQPMQMPVTSPEGQSGGRPPDKNPQATQSQRITAR